MLPSSRGLDDRSPTDSQTVVTPDGRRYRLQPQSINPPNPTTSHPALPREAVPEQWVSANAQFAQGQPLVYRDRLNSDPNHHESPVITPTDYHRRPSLPIRSAQPNVVPMTTPPRQPLPQMQPLSSSQSPKPKSGRGLRLSSHFSTSGSQRSKNRPKPHDPPRAESPVDYSMRPLPPPPSKQLPQPPSRSNTNPLENAINTPLIPVPEDLPAMKEVVASPQQSTSTSWLELDGSTPGSDATTIGRSSSQKRDYTAPIPISAPYYDDGLIPVVHDGLIPVEKPRQDSSDMASSLGVGSPHGVSGEILLFERGLWYSRNYSDFKTEGLKDAVLKVYESPLTGDLRFSFISKDGQGNEHHFEVPHQSCELVLAYAYESMWPEMVYLQKKAGHDSKDYLPPDLRQILCLCRFGSMEDLADFQSKILREDMSLDISSTRAAKVKTNKLETNYPGSRLQIWHESKASHGLTSSGSSFVTYDTVLSGAAKEKTRPRYTRMILFFSRMEEYMSVFITDDLEMKEIGPTSVAIKARKYTGAQYFKSRSNIRGFHARRSSHAAGFLLGGAIDPNDEEKYKGFDRVIIEFENQNELAHFTSIWDQAIQWRREQRKMVTNIEKEMDKQQFTGRNAAKIWF